jgi:hypothetical protein
MDMNGFSNSLKTWTLMAALGGILVAVGGLIGGQTGLVLAFGFAILLNGFVYWKSDSIALRANGARALAPGEHPRLVSTSVCSPTAPASRCLASTSWNGPSRTPSQPAATRGTPRSPSPRACSR